MKKSSNTPKEDFSSEKKNTDVCQVCGRQIFLTAGNWREDDDGMIYCLDCWDEHKSCGCSD